MKMSRDYLTGLQNYWHARPRTAIEHLSKSLADIPDHPLRFYLYRLWIEILADEKEIPTLKSLLNHLEMMSREEHDCLEEYFALRGLIHFELDEIDAAKVFAKGFTGSTNLYGLELQQLLNLRLGKAEPLTLLAYKNKIDDYFHLKTLLQGLMMVHDEPMLHDVLKNVQKKYPNSPLLYEYRMHLNFEIEDFSQAALDAEQLIKKFPGNTDYNYYAGYAYYKCGNFKKATDILVNLENILNYDDPDVVNLTGVCFSELFFQTRNENIGKKAIQYLKKAEKILKDQGCSPVVPAFYLERLGIKELKKTDDQEGAKFWFINLAHRDFYEICSAPVEKINYLFQCMGEKPRGGDLCFFAGPDYLHQEHNEKRSRIGAIYSVSSDAQWHPLKGYVNLLNLEFRPHESIPIDVAFVDEFDPQQLKRLDKGHPFKHGVYELDLGALDLIEEAMKRHHSEEIHTKNILNTISNLKTN